MAKNDRLLRVAREIGEVQTALPTNRDPRLRQFKTTSANESAICCPRGMPSAGPLPSVVSMPKSRAIDSGKIELSAPVSTRATTSTVPAGP